jgi:hypothetical protein
MDFFIKLFDSQVPWLLEAPIRLPNLFHVHHNTSGI